MFTTMASAGTSAAATGAWVSTAILSCADAPVALTADSRTAASADRNVIAEIMETSWGNWTGRTAARPGSSAGAADDGRDGAVIGHGVILGAEAPDDVVGELGAIDRQLALGVQAGAAAGHVGAAAVAIGDQVALPVGGV